MSTLGRREGLGREGGAPSRCSQAPPRLRGALSAVCPAGQIIQSLEVAKASDIAEACAGEWQRGSRGHPGEEGRERRIPKALRLGCWSGPSCPPRPLTDPTPSGP